MVFGLSLEFGKVFGLSMEFGMVFGLSLEFGIVFGLSMEFGMVFGLSMEFGMVFGLSMEFGMVFGLSIDTGCPVRIFWFRSTAYIDSAQMPGAHAGWDVSVQYTVCRLELVSTAYVRDKTG
jgi:hypothetical protein